MKLLGRWGTTTSGCGALFRCYPALLAEGPRPDLRADFETRALQGSSLTAGFSDMM